MKKLLALLIVVLFISWITEGDWDHDNAMSLVFNFVPEPSDEQEDVALDSAMRYMAARGVTSVHTVLGPQDSFERAYEKNALTTRIYASRKLGEWKIRLEEINRKGR